MSLEGREDLKFPALFGCCIWLEADFVNFADVHPIVAHLGESSNIDARIAKVETWLDLFMDKEPAIRLAGLLLQAVLQNPRERDRETCRAVADALGDDVIGCINLA